MAWFDYLMIAVALVTLAGFLISRAVKRRRQRARLQARLDAVMEDKKP
jgi:hypothetical protein